MHALSGRTLQLAQVPTERVMNPNSTGQKLLCSGPSQPRPIYLSIWMFTCTLYHIL